MSKRLMTWMLIISCICVSTNSWAALQADTAWAVDTAGSDTNGGCYDTGGGETDYTDTETTAVLSLTDLAQTLSSTTLTSAVGGFTAAMANNCIQITGAGTGAFTLGFYEITAFTNSNTVTIDRTACSTANCSGGTGAVGGALATIQKAFNAGSAVDGHTVYIKAGTYSEAITVNDGATTPNFTIWEGFNSSRGDNPTGTNRPLINCTGNTNCINFGGNDNHRLKNIRITGATDDCMTASTASGNAKIYENVAVYSCGGDGIYDAKSSTIITKSELYSNTGYAVNLANEKTAKITATYIHDNTSGGVNGNYGSIFSYNTVFESNSGSGVSMSMNWDKSHILNSVSYNNSGVNSDGFSITCNNTSGICGDLMNSISSENGDDGVVCSSSRYYMIQNMDVYNNVGNAYTTCIAASNSITTDPSFVNAAAGDFTVNSGSGVLDTGLQPDTTEGLTGDYKINIGVDQDDVAASGSASAHTFVGGF